jgi:CDGSH iron-sulfur domain-containing protein 3
MLRRLFCTQGLPKVPQREPYEASLEAAKVYFWCSCGLSKKQPFCDGSHKGTGLSPIKIQIPVSDTKWLCGCKHSKTKPYCDGSHESLSS